MVFDLTDLAEPIQPVELVRVLRRRCYRRPRIVMQRGWISHHPKILEIKDRARREGRELTAHERLSVAALSRWARKKI